jgi:hypothetical protein
MHGHGDRRRASKVRPPWSPEFATALTNLRDEIARRLADPKIEADLSPLVSRLVTQARADSLRAEHVVVAFHAILDTLPERHRSLA